MTLILTALTPEHVVQVSDRRVVWLEASGRILKTNDEHIKAVITPGFACGYTGIADLGNGDTADWIATELSDHIFEPDGGITALTIAVGQHVNTVKRSEQRLAIVCAGWVNKKSGGPIPRATVISNFDQITFRPAGKFSAQVISIAKSRHSCVYPSGQPLHRSEFRGVNRDIENLCKSGRATARAIGQVLAECVQSVARSSDRKAYVSEGVLISSLPRNDRLRDAYVVGQLVEDFWSVTCIRGGNSRVEEPGGPIIVGDRAAIQALLPEDRPPGDGIFSGARIVRKPPPDGGFSLLILTNPPLGKAWGWPGRHELMGRPPC